MKKNTTLILVECALMIAMSTVLSMFKIFELPQGGAVTCASMVPLVLVSYRHGLNWGISTAFAHSLLQMLIKFNAPPTNTFGAFLAVILLDYVLAFTVLGTASFFGKAFKSRATSVAVGAVVVTFLRFLCSFFSGILIWGSYAPAGTPVWVYSLTYNGSYMLPEMIITAVVSVILIQVLDRVDHRSLKKV
jgi:thiamine transporter